jgi:phosphoribosylglycinamide formyltransferase-1
VIPALDAGPVLAQAHVPVLAGDTPESLAKRVQVREHPLLLRCVQALAAGQAFASPMRLNDADRLEPAT